MSAFEDEWSVFKCFCRMNIITALNGVFWLYIPLQKFCNEGLSRDGNG